VLELSEWFTSAMGTLHRDINHLFSNDPLLFMIILLVVLVMAIVLPVQAIGRQVWYTLAYLVYVLTHWTEGAVGKWRNWVDRRDFLNDQVKLIQAHARAKKWSDAQTLKVYKLVSEAFEEPDLLHYGEVDKYRKLSQDAADHKKKQIRERLTLNRASGVKVSPGIQLIVPKKRTSTVVHI